MADAPNIFGGSKLLPDGTQLPWFGFAGDLTDPVAEIVRIGDLRPNWQPGYEMDFSDEGLCVRTDRIACEESDVPAVLASVPKYSPHRTWPTLGVERVRVRGSNDAGGLEAIVEVIYAGMTGSASWPPVQEVINNTSAEPIETFRGFKTLTGLPNDPKDFVILDADGNFRGFTADAPHGLCGVDSYLSANIVIRRKWVQQKRPDTTGWRVGKLYFGLADAPPIDGYWFMNGLTWVRRGLCYVCAADFMDTGTNTAAAGYLYG